MTDTSGRLEYFDAPPGLYILTAGTMRQSVDVFLDGTDVTVESNLPDASEK
jgi:hypothetical protein